MIFMNRCAKGSKAAPTIGAVTFTPLHPLYPPSAPFRSQALPVAGGHVLHVDEFGHPQGVPALVLHGGPGSGCSPLLHRFFDPRRYRIVCADQRGAGASQPRGETAHNTTAHLLSDLRLLRDHLGIDRWLVVGGSWGATLAIAHAADLPQAASGLLLRATFLARAEDVDGFFASASTLLPQAEAAFAGDDDDASAAAALAWWRHEQAMSDFALPADAEPAPATLLALVDRYKVQAHYLHHGCWMTPSLLDRCAELPPVPTLLLHGTADRVCPPAGAMAVAKRVSRSRLQWVDGAGHDPAHAGMAAAMVDALDHFATHRNFDGQAAR